MLWILVDDAIIIMTYFYMYSNIINIFKIMCFIMFSLIAICYNIKNISKQRNNVI